MQVLQRYFSPNIGIAMGTPFTVMATNAFMYYLEKDVIMQFSNHLLLYKRSIDDIFCMEGSQRKPIRIS